MAERGRGTAQHCRRSRKSWHLFTGSSGPCPELLSLITTRGTKATADRWHRRSRWGGMEGAVRSIAAAQQLWGQPAEAGCLHPSPARHMGLPAWSLAALGAWGAPCGAGALWRTAGTHHPRGCLIPQQVGVRLPRARGSREGCRWVTPSKSPALI